MPGAVVTALKSFSYQGRALRAGEVTEIAPLDAAILARQQLVRLSGDLTAPRRVRRTYRRRDLRAESS